MSRPRLRAADQPESLLLTRKQAAHLLACSTATLIRLENAGRLRAIKLTSSTTSRTHYRRSDVLALVQPDRETGGE
jgi:hypothetical protein